MINIDYRIGLYLILINVITFILFSLDKKRAKSRQWRIPESTLLFGWLLGGDVGGLIGMQIFKHKTKKMKFVIGMPIILVFNIMILKYFATI